MATVAPAPSPVHLHEFSGYLPILHLPGGIPLPTYFLTVSTAFCICLYWLVRRTDKRALSRNNGLDLALVLMLFGMVGARLTHVIFEEPTYYWEAPSRVFEVWRGGFVWYGGAIAGALGFVIYLRQRRWPLGVWLDVYAPLCALGYAAGRVACVLVGCCYGRACEWVEGYAFRYPTQIFAVVWELSVLAILMMLERTRRTRGMWIRKDGQLFLTWIIFHALGRLIMEAFRGDPRGPTPFGLSVSTWVSVVLVIVGSYLLSRRAGWIQR